MKNGKEKFFEDKDKALVQMRIIKTVIGNINKNISNEDFEDANIRLKTLKKEIDIVIKILKLKN